MKTLSVIASVLLLAAVAAEDDGVLALTAETFDQHVGKGQPAFVEFYAPWCGHCKSLAPEWATLASTFKPTDGVVVAKVDADANREMGERFGVRGFPTIKWFPAGSYEPEDYNGGRTAADLVDFVNSKTGLKRKVKTAPSAVHALTPETFDATVRDPTKHTLVEFYAPWCGHCKSLAPVWEKLGQVFDGESNVVVAKVDADKHRELGERFGVQGFPTLKYIPAGGGVPEDVAEAYEGGRDLPSLVSFINEKAGTQRTASGGLLPTAGRVPAFDAFASAFMGAKTEGDKTKIAEEAKSAAGKLTGAEAAKADAYIKAMGRVLAKGEAWVAKETGRIEGLLSGEGISKTKRTELEVKKNVLGAFAAAPAGGAEADEEL